MKKSEIAEHLADRFGFGRTAAASAVDKALANGKEVWIVGFGAFTTKSRPVRTGHNPHTGESWSIPASTGPMIKPGKGFKDAVNNRNAS